MKTFLRFSLLVLVITTSLGARAQQGTHFLQGTSLFDYPAGIGSTTKTLQMQLSLGTFHTANQAKIWHVTMGFADTGKEQNMLKNQTWQLGIGKAQEWYKTIFGSLRLYAGVLGHLGYNYADKVQQSSSTGAFTESRSHTFTVSLGGNAGLYYGLHKHWALTLQLVQVNAATLASEFVRNDYTEGSNTYTTHLTQIRYGIRPTLTFASGIGIRYVW